MYGLGKTGSASALIKSPSNLWEAISTECQNTE